VNMNGLTLAATQRRLSAARFCPFSVPQPQQTAL
jgi:hypothetical protein